MADWDDFEIERRIGVGHTGTVWRARQVSVGRPVALKELAQELSTEPMRARLREEARVLAGFEHPNCVSVYRYLESGSRAAIAMEYIDGVSLREVIRRGPLSVEQSLSVLEGALQGLAYAHGRGVLHGDVKPENILLASSGESKLVDFGLATAVGTRRESGIGSPAYSSPEAAAGQPLDVGSDLYSAGLVLYELLTGVLPPGGGPAVAPGLGGQLLPEPVTDLVRRSLDPDPAGRPGSATAFLEDLRAAAEAGCGEDWRRRGAIIPLVMAAAAGAASAVGADRAVAAGTHGSGRLARMRALRHIQAHPLASALAAAGVLTAAGVGVGLATTSTTSSPPAVTIGNISACPGAPVLLAELNANAQKGEPFTAVDNISCWLMWETAITEGRSSSWVVFRTQPSLHLVTSRAERALFHQQVCATTASPLQWRTNPAVAACTTSSGTRLDGTYTISLPPGDQCGFPSLEGDILTFNGDAATLQPSTGGTSLHGNVTSQASSFSAHLTNGLPNGAGSVIVDLSGDIQTGGDLSGQSQNSGVYPGGGNGFACPAPFTAARTP